MIKWLSKRVILTNGKKQQFCQATAKYPNYFNVQMNDSSRNLKCINFDDVKEWKKVDICKSVEQVNVGIVPKQMHKDKEVKTAG